MLSFTKACARLGCAVAAFAVVFAFPLTAASEVESEAGEFAVPTLEAADNTTMACGAVGAMVFFCPDGVEEAASQAAAWECGQHGQVVDELTIDCWHLGGGYWRYTATVSCKEPETNLW